MSHLGLHSLAGRAALRRRALRLVASLFAAGLALGGAAPAVAAGGGSGGASPPPHTTAAPQPGGSRIVVLLAPGLRWDDITSPGSPLRSFAQQAAWASINVRGANGATASSYATLGAGVAVSAPSTDSGYNADTVTAEGKAADVLERRTGRAVPSRSVLFLDMPALQEAPPGEPTAGALGDALHRAGLRTAVWGNADLPGRQERGAVLLLADTHGVVDGGDVAAHTRTGDPQAPFGASLDMSGFRAWWTDLPPADQGGPTVVAIEFGGLRRQAVYARLALPAVAEAQRTAALERLAGVLATVRAALRENRDTLVLISPIPLDAVDVSEDALLPLAVWGRPAADGAAGARALTSPSTRRAGLVTAEDFAPTLLAWLGLPPLPEAVGREIHTVPVANSQGVAGPATGGAATGAATGSIALAKEVHDRSLAIDSLRPRLIKGWIVVYLVAMALAGIALVANRRPLRTLHAALVFLAAFGPACLLAVASPWPPWSGLGAGAADVAEAALVLTVLSWWLGRRVWHGPVGTIYALACLTTLLLTVDAARGGAWTRWSYMGYSALSGARFYGIGNELMGVWIGAVLVASVGLLERWPRRGIWGAAVLMLLCVGLLAWPAGGANFGGATAAILAFVPTFIYAWRGRVRWQDFAWAAVGFAVVIGAMVGMDWLAGTGHMSHVGRLAKEVLANGPAPLFRLALQKLSLEWHLIQLTIYTRLLAVFLASSAMLLLWSPEPLKRLWANHPALRVGAAGYGLATLAVLALNDSGVVAAATMLTLVAAAFFASVSGALRDGTSA